MIGFPYRKVVNSNEGVQQGTGLIVCSVGKARSLGIPTERWVFPQAGTDGADAHYVSNRTTFSGSPAIRIAGGRALSLAGVEAEALDHVDLYSCFPVAVQVAAHELGLSTDRDLTVTGGLPFAGGPWSNYVTHSIATMVERLRSTGGTGLVFAKRLPDQALPSACTRPTLRAGRSRGRTPRTRSTRADRSRRSTRTRAPRPSSRARSCTTGTTSPSGRSSRRAPTTASRVWGTSTDAAAMTAIETDETVGRTATWADDGATFSLA